VYRFIAALICLTGLHPEFSLQSKTRNILLPDGDFLSLDLKNEDYDTSEYF